MKTPSFFFKQHKNFCILISLLAIIIFVWPLFKSWKAWPASGKHDSDEILSYAALSRQAIVDFKQFPFWTPAVEGGGELFSHPLSLVYSPFFILILVFGDIAGIKLLIIAHFLFGFWGIYRLSRGLGCLRLSSWAASCIFCFSSILPLQVAEGVYYNLSLVWVPWAVLYFLKSLTRRKYIYLCIFFCLLILFSGWMYPNLFLLFFFLFFYALFESIRNKNSKLLKRFFTVLIFTLLLGSVRLLPLLAFLKQHAYLPSQGQFNNLWVAFNGLFSRNQLLHIPRHEIWGLPDNVSFWEYRGAYAGLIPYVLFFLFLPHAWKKHKSLLLCGLLFLAISFIGLFKLDLPGLCERCAFFCFLAAPTRYVWIFIFSLSLMVGSGLTLFEKKYSKSSCIALAACILALFIDLLLVNRPILHEAFKGSPGTIARQNGFIQAKIENTFKRSIMYQTVLENKGLAVDGIDLFGKDIYFCNAVAFRAERYKGEIFLKHGVDQNLKIIRSTPNHITLAASVQNDDLVIFNQNYNSQWRAKGLSDNRIYCVDGLLAVKVSPFDSSPFSVFYYPLPLFFGGLISLLTLLYLFLQRNKALSIVAMTVATILACVYCIGEVRAQKMNSSPVSFEFNQAYRHGVRGVRAFHKGDALSAYADLSIAHDYFPNSIILHRYLKQIYEIKGDQEGVRREREHQSGLLPQYNLGK